MSNFLSAFAIVLGVVAAVGVVYVSAQLIKYAYTTLHLGLKYIDYSLTEKHVAKVKEQRARAQREIEVQAKLYAGLLLNKLPELAEQREIALSAPYDRGTGRAAKVNNRKRARALTKIRTLVKSNWVVDRWGCTVS